MNEKAKAPQAPGPKAVNFTPQDFAVFEQVNPSGWIHLNAIRMERELAEKDAIIKNMAGRLVTNEQEKKAEKAPAEEPPAPEGVEAA